MCLLVRLVSKKNSINLRFLANLFLCLVLSHVSQKIYIIHQLLPHSYLWEAANILKDNYTTTDGSALKSLLFDHAIGELVSAQMAVVKVITFK